MFCVVWVITRNSLCSFNPTNKGHHSGPDCCGGFCIFNKVAIAIEYLVSLRKSVLSIWAQFTSCIVMSCIVFVWLICFLPVHQSWPLQGGNCRLGLPPWQVFIWNLPPYFKSNLSCIWNRFFVLIRQRHSEPFLDGWIHPVHIHPQASILAAGAQRLLRKFIIKRFINILSGTTPVPPPGTPRPWMGNGQMGTSTTLEWKPGGASTWTFPSAAPRLVMSRKKPIIPNL